jgi:hypothetical protein
MCLKRLEFKAIRLLWGVRVCTARETRCLPSLIIRLEILFLSPSG